MAPLAAAVAVPAHRTPALVLSAPAPDFVPDSVPAPGLACPPDPAIVAQKHHRQTRPYLSDLPVWGGRTRGADTTVVGVGDVVVVVVIGTEADIARSGSSCFLLKEGAP